MFQGQFFAGTNQPYPFIPIPLTPGPHSQPPSSDDLSNTTSPPVGFLDFLLRGNVLLDRFLSEAGQQDASTGRCLLALSGDHALTQSLHTQEGYTDFPGDANYGHVDFTQFNPHSQLVAGPPTPPNQPIIGQTPQQHFVNGHLKQAEIVPQPQPKAEPSVTDDQLAHPRGLSNSEEDELTPAQTRRKAQNRAAYV
jgi:hypothetical protein